MSFNHSHVQLLAGHSESYTVVHYPQSSFSEQQTCSLEGYLCFSGLLVSTESKNHILLEILSWFLVLLHLSKSNLRTASNCHQTEPGLLPVSLNLQV